MSPTPTWLAQLGAHGLVRGSFVPPAPIRELRDLTRARTMMTRERGREIQRLEKLLEDAGIKLSSVASDITGVSGRLMLQALIDGQRDPAALADLAKRRLRVKIPELTEALTGRFSEHHAFLARMYLEVIDQRTRQIEELNARIEVVMEPFQSFCALIAHHPRDRAALRGSDRGRDRRRHDHLPDRGAPGVVGRHLPGQQRVRRPGEIDRHPTGNAYLKAALGAAALSIANTHGTYLSAKYRRIAARRGPKKALVAVEHAILTAIWSMAHTGALYDDPGADYFTRRDPERLKKHALNQLQRLGYDVTLNPTAATA